MARTRQSKTVVLPNGNRVTLTVGSTQSGYYKTVSVKRPDGTGDSTREERKAGLFGSGWFDTGQPYKLSVPDWAWYQHHLGLAPICATCGIRKTPADRDKAVRAGKNYQGEWVCLDCDELDPGDVTTDTLDAANQRSQASPVVKELLTRDDFDAAIKGGEGVIVIEDYPNRTCTAHPVSCRHLQARHFVQKVIVNKRENGRYYLAGSFPEARRELDAEPCQGT